uniref:Uncharacterized protein n=1 Tax=Oryza brachyantha TaxID=4533 RepID=J3N868_ORYBR
MVGRSGAAGWVGRRGDKSRITWCAVSSRQNRSSGVASLFSSLLFSSLSRRLVEMDGHVVAVHARHSPCHRDKRLFLFFRLPYFKI